MNRIRIAILVVVVMLMGDAAMAHSASKKVVNRQYNQHQRIKHGVYNGSLTPREAGALRMQQAKVRHYKQMAMADGRITPAERNLINRTQKQANRNIYHQKHDRQVRCR